jgi:uncharacterized protein (TIGR02996 family)
MEEAFLRAIVDNPDDADARLIFADWLEDHGDPRAEFHRLQVELSRAGMDDRRGRRRLRRRAADWLERYGALFGPLLEVIGEGWSLRDADLAAMFFLHAEARPRPVRRRGGRI